MVLTLPISVSRIVEVIGTQMLRVLTKKRRITVPYDITYNIQEAKQ